MLTTFLKQIPLPEPTSEHDQFANDEEHAKNDFVVLGQPTREIDVEVGSAVGGELGSQVCERASATINGEHAALQQHESGQNPSPAESAQRS